MELLPFDEPALRHFIYLERPEGLDMADQDALAAVEKATALPVASEDEIGPRLQDFDTISELYRAIELGLDRLAEKLGEARLFLGPPAAQATPRHFRFPGAPPSPTWRPAPPPRSTRSASKRGARGDWLDAHLGGSSPFSQSSWTYAMPTRRSNRHGGCSRPSSASARTARRWRSSRTR